MTLIVSLRIPDGIVLAGDSLATMMGDLNIEADVSVKCPNCNHDHVTKAKIAGIAMPSTTFSYAQKVFPFLNDFGIGTSGAGQLVGKTIYFAMRELEQRIQQQPKAKRPKDVAQVADRVGQHFLTLLKAEAKNSGIDTATMPTDWRPLGFQIVGYQQGKATTVELQIGKNVNKTVHDTSGVTVTGMTDLTVSLFERYKTNPQENPAFNVFSLQDAIAYAEFLINTTATHQQFSRTIANVGGEIDIALVTPFDHFRWIRQKSLQALIGGQNETIDS